MLVGRLPRGGRRDGIFRLGTRPGRRRRRRRRRGGSRLRLVLQPRPPGRAGMRRDRRPAPPRRRPPASHPRRRRPAGGRLGHPNATIPPVPKGASEAPGKTRPSTPPTARATSARLRGAETRARPSCVRESRAESARSTTGELASLLPRVSAFFGKKGGHFRRSFLGSSRVRSDRQQRVRSEHTLAGKPIRKTQ